MVLGGHSFGGATVLSAAAQTSVVPVAAVFTLGAPRTLYLALRCSFLHGTTSPMPEKKKSTT